MPWESICDSRIFVQDTNMGLLGNLLLPVCEHTVDVKLPLKGYVVGPSGPPLMSQCAVKWGGFAHQRKM